MTNRTRTALTVLSARETEIFVRLGRGEQLALIASESGIAASTASTYRQRVLDKLRLSSNADIAVMAHRAGLVRSPRV